MPTQRDPGERALAARLGSESAAPSLEATPPRPSDIDFLVDLDAERGPLDLGGLLMDLRDLLGHNVDVTTEAGLRPRVAQRLLADAIDL